MGKNIKGLVLITGTTSGVGLNSLQPLLRFGWEVIAVNRSNKRAIKIAEQLLTEDEMKNIHFIEIDLSNLDDVRKGCGEILKNSILSLSTPYYSDNVSRNNLILILHKSLLTFKRKQIIKSTT